MEGTKQRGINMSYYFIRQPSDKMIVGVSDGGPQAELIESKFRDKNALKCYFDFTSNLVEIAEKVEHGKSVILPNIDFVKLRSKAKLTDFLSYSDGHGEKFLITGKVNAVLEEFNVNCLIGDNVNLFNQNQKVDGYYSLTLLPVKVKTAFKFDECVFYKGSTLSGTKTLFKANSNEEYLEKRLIFLETLVLKESAIRSSHLFTFDFHPRIYISDWLGKRLQQQEITGITISKPYDPVLKFA